jgi:Ca-activated chloride channel family protein
MNDKIAGRSKWEIVKIAAKKIVSKLPDDALVGLRVYGHNKPNPYKVDERETELLMPVAKLDRKKFESIVDSVKPQGRTPIAMSFDRTSTDLGRSPACRVLLLSDGAETGGGNPVEAAKRLIANPKCLAIDCLGFDIVSEPKARAELQEVARIGKGRYTESEDPEVLARAGARTGAEYVLLDAAGKEVQRGTLGDSRPLPEGEYRIRVTINDKQFDAGLWIDTGVETKATVHPERAK